MGRKRHTPEQIITALREAEVGLARGKSVKLISREYGGMKVSQARRLKELERENGRLKLLTVAGRAHEGVPGDRGGSQDPLARRARGAGRFLGRPDPCRTAVIVF